MYICIYVHIYIYANKYVYTCNRICVYVSTLNLALFDTDQTSRHHKGHHDSMCKALENGYKAALEI